MVSIFLFKAVYCSIKLIQVFLIYLIFLETLSRLKIEKVGSPEGKIPNIKFYYIESIEFLKKTPGAVMKNLRDNIRTIMEEKR